MLSGNPWAADPWGDCDAIGQLQPQVDVHAWYAFTGALERRDVERLYKELSREEVAACDRLLLERDRRDFAAAHALLRRTLSLYEPVLAGNWRFARRCDGKPCVAPEHVTTLEFNLSHATGLVACAVARHALVGIDVEAVDRLTDDEIPAGALSPAERSHLDRVPDGQRARRFIEVWTLKESYLKACGVGLARELDRVSVLPSGENGVFVEPAPGAPSAGWQLGLFSPSSRHRLAVAVHLRAASPRCRVVVRDAAAPTASPLVPLRWGCLIDDADA